MIHPLLSKGRVLFVRNSCPYCSFWKARIYRINFQLKPEKRIRVIDCTKYFKYGIYDHPIIKVFEPFLSDSPFPTLFIDGERKEGATSVIECESWLRTRVFNDFIFPQDPEYLDEINKYMIFDLKCKFEKKRIVCEKDE